MNRAPTLCAEFFSLMVEKRFGPVVMAACDADGLLFIVLSVCPPKYLVEKYFRS